MKEHLELYTKDHVHYVDKGKKDRARCAVMVSDTRDQVQQAHCRHEEVRLRHIQEVDDDEASQMGPAALLVPRWPHHEESVNRDCRVLV